MEWVSAIEFWHWWVLAVAFVILEIFTVGIVFFCLAIGAVAAGLLVLIVPGADWKIQLVVFAVGAMAVAPAWKLYQKRRPAPETDQPALNRRGTQYVGRTFTLEQAVVNGQGKLKIDDTIWKVEGEDLPEGAQVKVTGVEGTVLEIERA